MKSPLNRLLFGPSCMTCPPCLFGLGIRVLADSSHQVQQASRKTNPIAKVHLPAFLPLPKVAKRRGRPAPRPRGCFLCILGAKGCVLGSREREAPDDLGTGGAQGLGGGEQRGTGVHTSSTTMTAAGMLAPASAVSECLMLPMRPVRPSFRWSRLRAATSRGAKSSPAMNDNSRARCSAWSKPRRRRRRPWRARR